MLYVVYVVPHQTHTLKAKKTMAWEEEGGVKTLSDKSVKGKTSKVGWDALSIAQNMAAFLQGFS